ncbi:MAG: NAD(P)/FAD-dependent oxidoreductase [Nanoarchaeota archaeon]
MELRDIIIIGAGPAGLTAAIYAARYKLDVAVLTKEVGGMAATAHKVCNYPGFTSISGFELMQKMADQAEALEVPILHESVVKVSRQKDGTFVVSTAAHKQHHARKVIFTGGTERRKLDIPGEKELLGKGVSYCATCDGGFFRDKKVAVIGGSDAALTAALLLSEYATAVTIIYRKDRFFRAEPSWVDLVEKDDKITTVFEQEVEEIMGEDRVTGVRLTSGDELAVDGVFIEIGSVPNLRILHEIDVEVDGNYIVTDEHRETATHGLYAAGDVIKQPFKQIVTAAAHGAVAAFSAYQALKKEEKDDNS